MGSSKRYSKKVWADIKAAYMNLEKSYSFEQLAEMFPPSKSAIFAKAQKVDPATGLSWIMERKEAQDSYFLSLSPTGRLRGLQEEFDRTLQNRQMGAYQRACALKSLSGSIKDLRQAQHDLPGALEMLEDMAKHIAKHFPGLPDCCRKSIKEALTSYRDEMQRRYEEE